MCIVLKQEIDGVPVGPTTENVDIPIKVETIGITSETEVPTAGQTIGWTQSEINAALNLVRDWPKATTESDKQLLLVRNCLVLGKSGIIVPLADPPQMTRELRPNWDIVKGLAYPTKLSHWYYHLTHHTTTKDKLLALVSLTIHFIFKHLTLIFFFILFI